MAEIQLGRHSEPQHQRPRMGHRSVYLPSSGADAFIAQMLQRKINEVKINAFHKQTARRDDLATGRRFKRRILGPDEARTLIKQRYRLLFTIFLERFLSHRYSFL